MAMVASDNQLQQAVRIPFATRVRQHGAWPLIALAPTVLQMNLGYHCNQHCGHCHLEAGPERREAMSDEVIDASLAFAAATGITEFDLTGGAPELHPGFRRLVEAIRRQGGAVTDRCNLTILSEPGQEGLADFLAAHRVRVMASLPHYRQELTDRVRGRDVFSRSIAGLRALNAAGYGLPDGALALTLVYNPPGAVLPPDQQGLEADFRRQLAADYGVTFTRLIAIANVPTGRFLRFLTASGNLPRYLARLEGQFNPATLPNLMCRSLISVGWDGTLYDCDFNQSLGVAIRHGQLATIQQATRQQLAGRAIDCRDHCYSCTAGQGSSCGGAVAPTAGDGA